MAVALLPSNLDRMPARLSLRIPLNEYEFEMLVTSSFVVKVLVSIYYKFVTSV